MARRRRKIRGKPRGLVSLRSIRFRLRSRKQSKRDRRRSRRARRSPNFWRDINKLTFSKAFIQPDELLWLEVNAPTAKITLEYVPGYQYCPTYKLGKWDGKAYVVRFDPEDETLSYDFRHTWWHRKCR
jgi:hypothetical protein